MSATYEVDHDHGNIGRMAAIVHNGKCYIGNVLDQVDGTTFPKRIRVQYDPFLQGVVLMPGQYEFKEWADDGD
jgi:hypothetical protein